MRKVINPFGCALAPSLRLQAEKFQLAKRPPRGATSSLPVYPYPVVALCFAFSLVAGRFLKTSELFGILPAISSKCLSFEAARNDVDQQADRTLDFPPHANDTAGLVPREFGDFFIGGIRGMLAAVSNETL